MCEHLKQTAWFCNEESRLAYSRVTTAWCKACLLLCHPPIILPSSFVCVCFCRCRARIACCCLSQPGPWQRSSATLSTHSACSITCRTSSNGQGRKANMREVSNQDTNNMNNKTWINNCFKFRSFDQSWAKPQYLNTEWGKKWCEVVKICLLTLLRFFYWTLPWLITSFYNLYTELRLQLMS